MDDAEKATDSNTDPVYYAAALRLAATLYDEGQRNESLTVATKLLGTIEAKLEEISTLPQPHGRMKFVLAIIKAFPNAGLRFTAALAERFTRNYLERLHRRLRNVTLEKYLVGLRPSLLIMIAGLKIANGDAQAMEAMENDPRVDCTVPSALTQYNLACTYSVAASKTRNDKLKQKYLASALSHLAFAQRLQPRHSDAIKADMSLNYLKEQKSSDVELLLIQYKPKPRVTVSAQPAAAQAQPA